MTLGIKQGFGARLLLLLAGLAGVHGAAQGPTGFTARVEKDRPEGLIKLDVLVTDGTGKPAIGLNASDLRLLENGREQKILSFDAFNGRRLGSEPPVKIILLIDTIDMPPELEHKERRAVEAYLRKDGGQLAHPVSVLILSDTALWTVTRPSGDGNVLAREIEHNTVTVVRRPPSWHNSAGAIARPLESASMALGQIATNERRIPGRKLLLWIGPGWGNGTGAIGDMGQDPKLFGAICWFSDLLRESRLVLYSFTVGESEPSNQLYKDHLAGVTSANKATQLDLYRKVLAVQSGGRVLEPNLDLVSEIESCVEEGGSYYRISFDPLHADQRDEYHSLKVKVDDRGLAARTNTGYYDEPFYSVDQIPPLRRMSLDELQKILELDESDADKAKQLAEVELTERLSEHRLAKLEKIAHGKRTRQELRILADMSSFLPPPADETVADPPPSADEQQHIFAMTSDYLSTTIHKLPDLFAKRTTVRYQETPMYLAGVNYQPLHPTDNWTTNIRYRNGSEVTDKKTHALKTGDPGLITSGEFGPVLYGVLEDIHKNGQLSWARWEQGGSARMAVFRFTFPGDTLFYKVGACCLPDGDGTEAYVRYPRYHGEIAIDPGSGAILRLTFQSDLKSTTPLSRSDIAIEYGPVDMGGKTYICPIRSVSILRARSVRVLSNWDEWFRIYGPYATMLNDMSFERYHVFRTNSRILTDFTPAEK